MLDSLKHLGGTYLHPFTAKARALDEATTTRAAQLLNSDTTSTSRDHVTRERHRHRMAAARRQQHAGSSTQAVTPALSHALRINYTGLSYVSYRCEFPSSSTPCASA
jgi:hypothetical protein